MASNKSVAVKPDSGQLVLMTDTVPDYINAGRGRGSENVEMSDIVIPRIELIQPLSPAKDKKDPAYIEGIEEGQLFNTVTRQSYGEHLSFVPVYFRKVHLLFKARKAGGGFRGSFSSAEEAEAAKRIQDSPGDHEVIECAEHFCLALNPSGGYEEAIIAMTKTKLKVSRQLNSLVRLRGGDRFSFVYQLGSVQQKNDKGTYWNFSVKPLGFPAQALYTEASKIYEMIASGDKVIEADHRDLDTATDDGGNPEM